MENTTLIPPPTKKPLWLRLLFLVIHLFVVFVLTIITQIGGIVYLLSFPLFNFIHKRIKHWAFCLLTKGVSFIALYLLATFVLVPLLAKQFGREPLPITSSPALKPATTYTFLCNRHYVTPALKEVLLNSSQAIGEQYQGTITYYLDANFPFINGFPLLPHLSHNNGKKVDIAFYYTQANSTQQHGSPSPIGYGVGEPALPNEINQANICLKKGYWQYSQIQNLMGRFRKDNYVFDEAKTKQFLAIVLANESVGKVFIEPHLAIRLGIKNAKLKFQGCHSVRHDDHIHLQLK